ncbi:hypothetical protein [Streptomyces formicae]|uniref:Uncharacterized protein n=1 Tax=Streptomyces formicae TaxID=1616117 RepID=A0ABY3WVA2_9ACTN|nr:hypothetical protein [Streptomyces formicae]UNM16030.1 hypothetical protein J4032_35265 [Streptomyces formicae]
MRSLTVRVTLGSLEGPVADLVRLTAALYEAREADVPGIAEGLWGAARAAGHRGASV